MEDKKDREVQGGVAFLYQSVCNYTWGT